MAERAFSEILELLESHGWVLQRTWPPYFVFMKEGELPLLIPVRDRKVSAAYVDKIYKSIEDSE